MLTQQRIQELIRLPKTIIRRRPSSGYQEESGSRRCDLDLRSHGQDDGTFGVFIRQNLRFAENFSIGLRYRADLPLGAIILLRYNGPHGERSRAPDGHYAKPHIHRITQQEITSGSTQPQERDRTITDKYATLEQALWVFFNDAGVSNHDEYFPELAQMRLSYGQQ